MARILTANEICERALRTIGAFPVTDSAPDGEQLREAMHSLDLLLGEFAGTGRVFWLVPETLRLDLRPEQAEYNLAAELGAQYPRDGIQFPVGAVLEDEGGNRYPFTLLKQDAWRAIGNRDTTGIPATGFMNRAERPTLSIFPVLPDPSPLTYRILLDVQTYSPNVAPGGVTGTVPQGGALTKVRQAWQRWTALRLAMDIGSGPVKWLPEQRLQRLERQAAIAERLLLAYENQEHDTEWETVAPHHGWDFEAGV